MENDEKWICVCGRGHAAVNSLDAHCAPAKKGEWHRRSLDLCSSGGAAWPIYDTESRRYVSAGVVKVPNAGAGDSDSTRAETFGAVAGVVDAIEAIKGVGGVTSLVCG